MSGVRYFLKSMNVLNGLLVLAIAAMVYWTVIPFLDLDIKISLPPVKEMAASEEKEAEAPENQPLGDYAMISEQNLFHPDRVIPVEKKEEKAIPQPEIVLYGTLITRDRSVAFIEDKKAPASTPGRGRRQVALGKGEQLGGYVLRQIEADRIVLFKGDERMVVMLDDGKARKPPETPATPVQTTAGIMPGSPQPGVTVPVPSPPQTIVTPGPGGGVGVGGIPGARPVSRQSMMLDVKRRAQDAQKQVP